MRAFGHIYHRIRDLLAHLISGNIRSDKTRLQFRLVGEGTDCDLPTSVPGTSGAPCTQGAPTCTFLPPESPRRAARFLPPSPVPI